MKIKPLFDKIVLTKIEVNKSTKLILPNLAEEKPDIAQVYAVGTGGEVDGKKIEIILKVGDKVLFNNYSASNFEIEGKTYILIKQSDILAVVE